MDVKVFGGDFLRQNGFIKTQHLKLQTNEGDNRNYSLKEAIQTVSLISEEKKKVTFSIQFKDNKVAVCEAVKSTYDHLNALAVTSIKPQGSFYEDDIKNASKPVVWLFMKKMVSIAAHILLLVFALSLISNILTSYENQDEEPQDTSLPVLKANKIENKPTKLSIQETNDPKNKIAEYAVRPITKSGYPTTYKKWGSTKIKHINSLQNQAADKIALSKNCDRLEMIGLSSDRSKPPSKIVFFADCLNGERFYINEAEIKASGTVKSKNNKLASITDHDAQRACVDKTKAMLHFPSSFDLKSFSVAINRAKTGNIGVTFDFNAKNGLGNVLPQKARCIIDDQGIHPVEITNR